MPYSLLVGDYFHTIKSILNMLGNDTYINVLKNFHTIKSILNLATANLSMVKMPYFHTIKSILNVVEVEQPQFTQPISILLSLF